MGNSLLAVVIDGQETQVAKDTTVLDAGQRLGIRIPTLCYHPALAPYGACRLCIVEVKRGGRSRLVTSCNYPIREDGLTVETHSPSVLRNRRMIVELLLARCPKVRPIQDLAHELGVERPRFSQEDENEDCILCGLCVRVCEELIGASAIGFAGRGHGRQVTTPYSEPSETCIGCGACAYVCPTGAIRIEDVLNIRNMVTWHTQLERRACRSCGKYFGAELALDSLADKAELVRELLAICPECRRDLLASRWLIGTRVSVPHAQNKPVR